MADTLSSFDEVTHPANGEGDVSLRALPIIRGMVGTIIANRFELLDLIAEGGMGTVYRARDHELDDVVALKMLRADVAGGYRALDLFRQEVKLARRVTHRNVARIYELGEHEGRHFLTMEFIQGEPLSATLRSHGRLSARLAVYVLGAVCEALEAAHAVGVVHRDIKPSNVLIASDGRVVLTDFGLARTGYSIDTGLTVGTPAYMAPEQVQGGNITPATDVYALGAMAFELVTGRKPWTGSSLSEVALARLGKSAPDPRSVAPSVPDSLALAIMRCMEEDSQARFGSMRQAAMAFMTASPETQIAPLAPTLHTARMTPKHPLLAVLHESQGASEEDVLISSVVEDLVDALSSVKSLRVMARGAVRRASKDGLDPLEVGKSLGARAVVGVSKRVSGERTSVCIRLVQVSDGVQLWANRFDMEETSILDISRVVTGQMVEAFTSTTSIPERSTSTDSLVVDLYLRARHNYMGFTFDSLGRAIDLYEQARARAPEDPLVCSGLAIALVRRWFWDFDGTREWAIRARDAVETALRVAPWHGEPHLALATLLLHTGDSARAAKELRHAIACCPSLAQAHELLGRILNEAGYVREATLRLESARVLDPFSSVPLWEFIRNTALSGRWDEFDRLMAQALRPHGKRMNRWTSHVRYAAWRRDQSTLEAIASDFEKARKNLRFNLGAVDAYINVALRGEPFEPAQRAMEDRAYVEGASTRRTVFYLQMQAELAGIIGDETACLRALQRADSHGLLDLMWLEYCPLLRIVSNSVGFQAVCSNVRQRAQTVYDALYSF